MSAEGLHGKDLARRLPNLLVLGAPKSGTTSLYAALRKHSEIFMTTVKEPAHFNHARRVDAGLDAYVRTHFAGAESFRIRGEATPWYLYLDPEPIVAALGDGLRGIIVLRDPVDRAYSMYWDQRRNGSESRSFAEVVASERGRIDEPPADPADLPHRYLHCGMYAAPVARWSETLGSDRLLVLVYEELVGEAGPELEMVWRFLDVEPEDLELARSNPSGEARSPRLQRAISSGDWLPERARRAIRRTERVYRPLLERVAARNIRARAYEPIAPEIERDLGALYADDVTKVEALLGRRVDAWH